MKPLGLFLAATLAPAAVGSDLLEEAKGILRRLGNPGDYGRSAAELGIREARAAAEGLWPTLDSIYRQRWNEAQAGLAEARRLWSLPMSRPALAPTWSSLEANLTAYGSAMASVTAARSAYSAAANLRSTDSLNAVNGDLRRHGDEALGALRALLPSPVGNRPATKKGRCRDPLTKIEIDCQVPNGPPSESEIRAAIAAGNAVLTGIAKGAAVGRNEFEKRLKNEMTAMLEKVTQATVALIQVTKAVQEAQIRAIQNLK
ncbi:MAG: hypothetical protein WCL47_11555 [Holophagaceae bacterium]